MSSDTSVSSDSLSSDVSSEYVSTGYASGTASASDSSGSASSASSGSGAEVPLPPDGEVHRSPLLGEDEPLMTRVPGYEQVKTTHDAFMQAVDGSPHARFLGTREKSGVDDDGNQTYGAYVWKSYAEVAELAQAFGSALVKMGMGEGVLGVYMDNCEELVIAQLGAQGMGFAVGGMYDTLGEQALSYCMSLAEMRVVLTSAAHVPNVLAVAARTPSLKYIIYPTDGVGRGAQAKMAKSAKRAGIKLVSMAEAYSKGARGGVKPWASRKKLGPHTLNTLCFTSGTTGQPKAVELTHGNMIADLAAGMAAGLALEPFSEVHISYLSAAHVFEKLIQLGITLMGGAIGFYTSVPGLMNDIQTLRPTIFPAVPRVLTKIHAKVTGDVAAAGGLKAKLFNSAYATKKKNMEAGGCCCCCRGAKKPNNTHAVYDRLVFKKVRAALGGRVKVIVTGSAPLEPQIMEFLRIAFACTVLEGYGQSESAAAATLTAPSDFSLGHVGFPIPCNEIALRSVPAMAYYATPAAVPRKVRKSGKYTIGGEICFRGANIMRGYFKNPAKTAETIDADGWLHSGDIGVWLDGGQLKIVDRVKALFKLSHGEYVSPNKVEDVASLSPLVASAFVYGDSLQNYVVAVIVPSPAAIAQFADDASDASSSASSSAPKKKSKSKSKSKAAADPFNSLAFRTAVLASIDDVARAPGADGRPRLLGFEIPKNIHLHPRDFADDDLLTPTAKIKRNVARDFFEDIVTALYTEGPIISSKKK